MKTRLETMSGSVREFDVRIYHGDLTVSSVEGNDWEFAWSADRDDEAAFERDGDTVRIRQRGEPHNPPRLNIRLTIPAGTEVIGLRTGNGRVNAEGLHGQVSLETGNGDMTLRAAGGELALATSNGKIQAFDVDGKLHAATGNGDISLQVAAGDVTLDTNNGRIEVIAPRQLNLTIHSSHGDIQIGDGPIQHLSARTNAGNIQCSADLADAQHHLASGHGNISIRASRGDVVLETAAGRITASDTHGRLQAHTGNGDIQLQTATGTVVLDTNAGRIEVRIPRDLQLQATSGNGDIQIGDGSIQALQLETKRGTINCAATLNAGSHTVTNGHGDVIMRTTRGDSLLKTGAGRIEVQDSAGKLTGQSGSGDIQIRTVAGEAELKTNDGRIEVNSPRAYSLQVSSGHGDIRIGEGLVQSLQLTTSMGRVNCAADLGTGQHTLNSGNGDVSLKLRTDAQVRLDAQTSFGQVNSDFPLVRVGRSGSMSFNGMRMVGSLGVDPEITITLRSGRGQIEVRRKDENTPRYQAVAALPIERPTVPEQLEPPSLSAHSTDDRMMSVLQALASGEISLEQADSLLAESRH